jgi:hypothetical protein
VLLASAVAVLHGVVVVVMLTGALVALRRPRFVLVHAPVALAVLAVNLAGADCPLTDLELALRVQAGEPAYGGGFLGHHVFAPLGLDVAATGTQVGIYTAAVGLNAVGYGLLIRRRQPLRGAGAGAGGSSPVTRATARCSAGTAPGGGGAR